MLFPLPIHFFRNQRVCQRFQVGKFILVRKDDRRQLPPVNFAIFSKNCQAPAFLNSNFNIGQEQDPMSNLIRTNHRRPRLPKQFRGGALAASDSADDAE